MMKEESKAWAIKAKIKSHPAPYFMGIFNFVGYPLEPSQDGMRTGLFRTRKQARDEAKKHTWAKARAVRVVVTIKEAVKRSAQ